MTENSPGARSWLNAPRVAGILGCELLGRVRDPKLYPPVKRADWVDERCSKGRAAVQSEGSVSRTNDRQIYA